MTAAGKNRDKLSEFRKYISRRVSLTDALDEFISGDLSQKIGDTGLMGRTVPVNEAEVLRNSMSQNRQRYTQTSLKLPEHLPESLILELTTRCNYACPYCYCLWHEYPHLGRYVLRTDQWKRVIRYAVERHVADFQFSGGEALLHPGAAELLRFTRELLPEGRLSLFTNGSRMTDALLLQCKRQRIALSTSLQGLRTYGAMTGTRRKYYRTLKLLYRAAELQWPFSVGMTVTRTNKPELPDMIAAAAVSGASCLQIGAVMPEGRARNRLDLTLSREEWTELKAEIREQDYGIPYTFCDEMICECRDQPPEYLARFGDPNITPCQAGKVFGVIGPDGSFRKCLHCI